MPVDPTAEDLKRFVAEDQGGPVVMLNLVANPEYQKITGLRTAALENAVLQATRSWG